MQYRRYKRFIGIHAFDTRARTLDEACDVIREYQTRDHVSKLKRERGYRPTLKQQISNANNGARARPITLSDRVKEKKLKGREKRRGAHPFWDLTDEQKREKARALYASGLWGVGPVAFRRLAARFRVHVGHVTKWMDDISAPL